MKLFATLAIALIASSTAIAAPGRPAPVDRVQACSNLKAIQEIANLEVASYEVRGYSSVTSEYMRLALSRIESLAEDAARAGARTQSVREIIESARYEKADTYRYSSYRLQTAMGVFTQIERDAKQASQQAGCIQLHGRR